MPWALTFTNPTAAANVGTPLNVPLHPTQLYESAAEALILFAAACDGEEGPRVPGRTFWLYMLMYGGLAVHHRVLPGR